MFSYDEKTGIFTANKTTGSRWLSGRVVGTKMKNGYLITRVNQKFYLLHRLAWLYVYGKWPNVIDHIDGNPSNNSIKNLRNVTQSKNTQNITKAKRNKKYSELIGAQWCKQAKKWKTSIVLNGHTKFLGFYKTPELASIAYKEASKKRWDDCLS